MKARTAWLRAADRLRLAGVPEATLEAEVLVRHALGTDRTQFYASLSEDLPRAAEDALKASIARRERREPLAYITGSREFYGLDMYVTPAVLVPRPETELLVEHGVAHLRSLGDVPVTVADACTGSGAIAVAIARCMPNATVYATDISYEALAVAEVNRRRHGVAGRVHLLHGDLLEPRRVGVDLLVSNPPYLASGAASTLAPEVLKEPGIALFAGEDGLAVIRRLVGQASKHLGRRGMLIVEISPEQAAEVAGLMQAALPQARVTIENDLSGAARAVKASLSGIY